MLSQSNVRVRESFMKEIRARLRKAIRSQPFVLHVCARCGFPDLERTFYSNGFQEPRQVGRYCPRCDLSKVSEAEIEVLPHSRVLMWIAYLEGHEIALSSAHTWRTDGDVGRLLPRYLPDRT